VWRFLGKNAFCERFSHNPVFRDLRISCFQNSRAQSLFWTFLADTPGGGSIINITPSKFYKNESVTQTFYHKDFSNFKRNIFGQKLSKRSPLVFPISNEIFSARNCPNIRF
jgi:hypothetical protein